MKKFITTILLGIVALTATAQTAVTAGSQVTDVANIVSGKAYLLRMNGLGNTYPTENVGGYYDLSVTSPTTACVYYLIKDGDTWKVKSLSGNYWKAPTSNGGNVTPTSDASQASEWEIVNSSVTTNSFLFTCNTFHPNRSGGKLVGHTNNNAGAQVAIYEINVANDIPTDQAYYLKHVKSGLYVNYENGEVGSGSNEGNNATLSTTPSPVYFTFANNGGFTLNTAGDNTGTYLHALTWNAGGSTSNSTAWVIAASGSYYTLSQTSAQFTGSLGTSGTTAGSKLYGNVSTATDITFEIVPATSGVTVSPNPSTNGTFSTAAGISGYYTTWTSGAASGQAGLTITTSGNLAMSQQNAYSKNLLGLKTTTENSRENFTITAPTGYVITGYSITARLWTTSNGYTLYDHLGTAYAMSTSGGCPATTITKTVSGTSSITLGMADTKSGLSSYYLCVTDMSVTLAPDTEGGSLTPTAGTVYTIVNNNPSRGAMTYDPTKSTTHVWSSGKSGATAFNATSANCQWVLYPTGTADQYYLYNVGADKFAIPTGIANGASNAWVFSDNAVALTLIDTGTNTGEYKIKMAKDPVSGTNAAIMSVSNGQTNPIINYDDAGSRFTITKVPGASAKIAADAAVGRLVSSQTALTAAPSSTGWYAIQINTANSATLPSRYLKAGTSEYTYNSVSYPMTFAGEVNVQPAISDATYYTRLDMTNNYWQMPNGKYLVMNASNKFPTSSAEPSAITAGYDGGNYFKTSNNRYADPYNSGTNYFIGETTQYRTTYNVYPINLATAGLTAWQVTLEGVDELTCSTTGLSGLGTVYNNGWFFLPTGTTPVSGEFTAKLNSTTVPANITVNTVNNTITVSVPTLTIVSPIAEASFTWNGETKTGQTVTFYNTGSITDTNITVSYTGNEYTSPTLSQNTWDGTASTTVTCTMTPAFFSSSYGEKWVRIASATNTSYVMGLTAGTNAEEVKQKNKDYFDQAQLWCFVGNASSFKIYNKLAGNTLQMASASTTIDNGVKAVIAEANAAGTDWKLVNMFSASDGPGWGICYASHDGSKSLNAWQGNSVGNGVAYWTNGSSNGGSHWVIEDASGTVTLNVTGLDASGMTTLTQHIANLPVTIAGATFHTPLTKDNFTHCTAYVPNNSELTFGTPAMFLNYSFTGYNGTDQTATVTATATPQTITATFGTHYADARYLWEPLRLNNSDYYRIPAIVTAKNGDVIAINDRRWNNDSDLGSSHHIDIIGVASGDNGQTWGSEFMVMDGNNGGEVGYGDAAVVADSESDQVLVMACGGDVSYQSSTNSNHQVVARTVLTHNGSTWVASAIEDKSSQFYTGALASSNGLFIGSGSLSQSTIIKKGDYYRIYCAVVSRDDQNYVLYSDDFGQTWTFLGGLAGTANEPKVAELPDGSVLLSVRKSYGRQFNVWHWDDDTYTTGSWGTAVATNDQTGGISFGANSCNGDIRTIPAVKVADGSSVVLAMQSVPTGNSRTGVSLYYKELDPEGTFTDPVSVAQNWSGAFQVTPHGSAYSVFNQQSDGRIAFYMEEYPTGSTGAGYFMAYVPLTISEITGGLYTSDAPDAETALNTIGNPINDEYNALSTAYEAYLANPTVANLSALRTAYNAYDPTVAGTNQTAQVLPTGYYTIANGDYARAHSIYNDDLRAANPEKRTLQNQTEVGTTNNYLWRITNNGDGTISINNGQGTPLTTENGAFPTLHFGTFVSRPSIFFTEAINASNGGQHISDGTRNLTTWTSGGAAAADNRWVFTDAAIDPATLYTIHISSTTFDGLDYVENATTHEVARDGGFMVFASAPTSADFASLDANYSLLSTVSGQDIYFYYVPTAAALDDLASKIGQVGYPSVISTAAQNYYSAISDYKGAASDEAKKAMLTSLMEAIDGLYGCTDIVMPQKGKVYTIRGINFLNTYTTDDDIWGYLTDNNNTKLTAWDTGNNKANGLKMTTASTQGSYWLCTGGDATSGFTFESSRANKLGHLQIAETAHRWTFTRCDNTNAPKSNEKTPYHNLFGFMFMYDKTNSKYIFSHGKQAGGSDVWETGEYEQNGLGANPNYNNVNLGWSTSGADYNYLNWKIEEVDDVYFAETIGHSTAATTFTYDAGGSHEITAPYEGFMVISEGTPTTDDFTTDATFADTPTKHILVETTDYKRVYFTHGNLASTTDPETEYLAAHDYLYDHPRTGLGYPKTTSAGYANLKDAVDLIETGNNDVYTVEFFKQLVEAYLEETDIVRPEVGKVYTFKNVARERYILDDNHKYLIDKVKGTANGLKTKYYNEDKSNPATYEHPANGTNWLCTSIDSEGKATFKSLYGNILGDRGCASSNNTQPYYLLRGDQHPYFAIAYGAEGSGGYVTALESETGGNKGNGLGWWTENNDDKTADWIITEMEGDLYQVIVNMVNAPTTYEDISPYMTLVMHGYADNNQDGLDYEFSFSETSSGIGYFLLDSHVNAAQMVGNGTDPLPTNGTPADGLWFTYEANHKIYNDFRDSTFVVDNVNKTITINCQFDYPTAIPALWEEACEMRDATGFGWPKANAASRQTMVNTLAAFEQTHYTANGNTWDHDALSSAGYDALYNAMVAYYENTTDADIELPINGASVLLVNEFHNGMDNYRNYVYTDGTSLKYSALKTNGKYDDERQAPDGDHVGACPTAPDPTYIWTLQRDDEQTVTQAEIVTTSRSEYTGSDKQTKTETSIDRTEAQYDASIAGLANQEKKHSETSTYDENTTQYTIVTTYRTDSATTAKIRTTDPISYTTASKNPEHSYIFTVGTRVVNKTYDVVSYDMIVTKVTQNDRTTLVGDSTVVYKRVLSHIVEKDSVEAVESRYPTYYLASSAGYGYVGRDSITHRAAMTNSSSQQFNLSLLRGTKLGTLSLLFIHHSDNRVRYITGDLAGVYFDWFQYMQAYNTNDAIVTGIWSTNWNFVQARNADTHKDGESLKVKDKAIDIDGEPNSWTNPIFEGFPVNFAASQTTPGESIYSTDHRYATLMLPYSVFLPSDMLNDVYVALDANSITQGRRAITLQSIKSLLTVSYDYDEDGIKEDMFILPRETPVVIDISSSSAVSATMDKYYLCPALAFESRAGSIKAEEAIVNNKLLGTLTNISKPSGDVYVLGRKSLIVMDDESELKGESLETVAFYRYTGSQIPANKAYLSSSVWDVASSVKMNNGLFIVDDEDGPNPETLIEQLTSTQSPEGEAIYDLAGRKLNVIPQKGVYIRNGKKYIAK